MKRWTNNYFNILYNVFGLLIPGGPEITEQSIQSIFQDFALINSYFICSSEQVLKYWLFRLLGGHPPMKN